MDTSDRKVAPISELFDTHGLGHMPFAAYREWKASQPNFQNLVKMYPTISTADFDSLIRGLYDVHTPIVKQRFVAHFSKQFTANELEQICIFYRSAAGRKMLEETPKLFSGMIQPTGPDVLHRDPQTMDGGYDQEIQCALLSH